MQRRTQFKIPIGGPNTAVSLGKMVDLFAGICWYSLDFFAHISLENTPNFPPFTRRKKETPSESAGEGSGVSFCLSMLVEGGLYQFYDFYTGIFLTDGNLSALLEHLRNLHAISRVSIKTTSQLHHCATHVLVQERPLVNPP